MDGKWRWVRKNASACDVANPKTNSTRNFRSQIGALYDDDDEDDVDDSEEPDEDEDSETAPWRPFSQGGFLDVDVDELVGFSESSDWDTLDDEFDEDFEFEEDDDVWTSSD